MSYPSIAGFRLRFALAVLISAAVLASGLLWGDGQSLSWAAPGQHPNMQTVPTRRPPTPEPAPTSSRRPPDDDHTSTNTQPAPPPEEEDATPLAQPSEEEDTIQPVQTPEEQNAEGQTQAPPTRVPEEGRGLGQTQVTPPQSAEEKTEEDDSAISEQADLSLINTVSNATPGVGQVLTFAVTISNNGPNNAADVYVSDRLPGGLILRSTMPSQGSYDAGSGLWRAGAIPNGGTISLSLVAMVMDAGTLTNTAEIAAANPFDPDSTPGNAVEGEDDQDSVSIVASLQSAPTTQSNDLAAPVSASMPASESLLGGVGLLSWLCALGVGVILILIGMFLARRA